MRWIQVHLTFNAEQRNMSRKNGMGVWRVVGCREIGLPIEIGVERHDCVPMLCIMAAREYRRGLMVNPKRLALDFVRAVADSHTLRFGSLARNINAGQTGVQPHG